MTKKEVEMENKTKDIFIYQKNYEKSIIDIILFMNKQLTIVKIC